MENNDKNKQQEEEPITIKEIVRSLVSISVCGALGLLASYLFGWSLWWSLGVGLLIGWALPGFIDGAKEELSTLKDEDNVKN